MKKSLLIFFLAVMMLPINLMAEQSREERAKEYYGLGKIYKEHGLTDFAAKEFEKAYDLVLEDSKNKVKAPKKKTKLADEEDRSNLYIVAANDTLGVNVWENPDLTGAYTIRPDGMVSFPLIGEFKADGMTIAELDSHITDKLKEYIRYPEVSVSLNGIGGRRVIILGEVKSPGTVQLADAHTLLEAIALAGGATKNAVLRSVLVIKGGLENPQPQRVNLARFFKKPNSKDNIVLEARDIVYVPETFLSDLSHSVSLILRPLAQGRVAHGDTQFYEDLIK